MPMTGMSSKFHELVDRDSIYDSLFENASPATVYRLGRTCRLAQLAVKDYTRRAFGVHEHLEKFFADPLGFRVLLARTRAIVSGSSALQFMGRMTYPQSDFDIFVANRYAAQVCDWIVRRGGKGYYFEPTDGQLEKGIRDVTTALFIHHQRERLSPEIDERFSSLGFYDNNRYRAVLNFKALDEEYRLVQVIVTHNTPMECLLSFHSTVVMNLITYSAAYSLFPEGTFEKGLMLPCDTREKNRDRGIEKYLQRGWKLAKIRSVASPHSESKMRIFVLGKRRVGDAKTWTIHFKDAPQVAMAAGNYDLETGDPITLNTFSMMMSTQYGLAEMRFSILKSPYFLNRYTTCPENSSKARFWLDEIRNLEETAEGLKSTPKWDSILRLWNKALLEQCSCLDNEHHRIHSCPAFISGFISFGIFAKHRLASGLSLERNLPSPKD